MFKKIREDAILPQAQTEFSAGYDVYSNAEVEIKAGQTRLIPLGICIDDGLLEEVAIVAEGVTPFDKGQAIKRAVDNFKKKYYIGLHLRSGLGKRGLIIPNGIGIVDMDYRDEIMMLIHNPLTDSAGYENKTVTIEKGDRVGQIIFYRHFGFDLLGSKYRKTDDRKGGFGSSGVK